MKCKNFFKTFFFLTLISMPLLTNCGVFSTSNDESPTTIASSPTPSFTALPSTKTSIPTLTSDQRLAQVKEWLATNAGCKLPCWWGIEPGKVTWDEVNEFLNGIGATSEAFKEGGMIFHETKGLNFNQERVINLVYFVEGDGLITSIIIDASGYNDSPEFKNIWASFSPENIILNYGIPSRVWVYSIGSVNEGSPGPTMPYSVLLFYDHYGILIRYSGQVKYEGIYKMCPAFSEQGNLSDYIYIYLQSPNTNIPLENLPTVNYSTNNTISIEEAAGISPNEFYELFTKPNIEPCFETPRDIWK